MRALFLLVNNVCDIACEYCFYTIGYEKRSPLRIPSQHANSIAERITNVGFDTVILTGGDPLQSRRKKETFKVIRELKQRNLRVIVNTSAALLRPDDLDEIVRLGVNRVDISVDSHDPEVHNLQRGYHQDVVNAITGLISRGFNAVTTTTVVTERNAPTLRETVYWLQSLGVKDIRVQPVFIPHNEATAKDVAILEAIRNISGELPASHTSNYVNLLGATGSSHMPCRAMCAMGKSYFVATAEGCLTPCFHRADIVLGNLFRDDVDKLRQSLSHHELAETQHPKCFGPHCVSLFDNPWFWKP